MKHFAWLTFGDDFDPDQFQHLVEQLGGARDFASWPLGLQRGEQVVWIDVVPVHPERKKKTDLIELRRLLGAEPRHEVYLHIPSDTRSEWLIAEVVVAAAEKWNFVLHGFDELPITMDKLNRRIARRDKDLFRTNPDRKPH
ncbi:hypothetical protein ACFYO1_02635 [Nocardia sp. NPDC006044]|uniref:hypothetical protein n=1 Tax=Nocardia sp. NPDC006044 TaxID=3364306 RepID=UPI0036B1B3C9